MRLEWDENKRIDNLVKHGLDFQDAGKIFVDKKRIEFTDNRKDYGENRVCVIGKIETGTFKKIIIALIVFVDRNGIIRIISARPANKKERRLYYGNS